MDEETTLSDTAWRKLLNAKGVDLAKATYPIQLTMADLSKIGGRQARLMNSMDERRKWPPVLRQHKVFPFSTGKTKLVLVKGDPFYDFPAVTKPRADYEARLPIKFVSGMLGRGENAHIMRLHTAQLLQKFLGGSALYAIHSGRRHSREFTVYINNQKVEQKGVQYDIDGQYESEEELVPIEMKPQPYTTCAIKQVYMPYRSLGEDTKWQKPVRPLYITYSQDQEEYVVRELAFQHREVWESLRVVKAESVRLRLKDPPPRLLNLSIELLSSNRVPQADKAYRIQDLPAAVKRGINNAQLLADEFQFDKRQSSYYRDAAEMLGLITTEKGIYILTNDGRRFADLHAQKQADALAARMCRLPAVNAVLAEMERRGAKGLPFDEIGDVVKKHAKQHREPFTGTTVGRRAQTIRAWLKFIGSRTGTVVLTDGRLYLRQDVKNLEGNGE